MESAVYLCPLSEFTTYLNPIRRLAAKILLSLALFLSLPPAKAQCPPNIDFEKGNFDGWTCYLGTTEAEGDSNFIYLVPVSGPVAGRHTMLSSSPGDGLDPYGGFPKNCPNGSGHSILLGNNDGAAESEGVSYDFTIPATSNTFRLTYSYAVVIQDPGHRVFEQPRMEVEILNLTDQERVDCSSFSFVADNSLPGFQISSNPQGNTPVLYKDWSSRTIILDGLQGKRIRFFVKTADCTYEAHFGYAYVDVKADCASSLPGSRFCPSDTAIRIEAPFGFREYTWYNASFTRVLGTDSVLWMSPPPPSGTLVAVELIPYPGYGCPDTLFQQLDTLFSDADAGPDRMSCNRVPVQIGTPALSGLVYRWFPAQGLSDAAAAQPFAQPDVITWYRIEASSPEGGCLTRDTVRVEPRVLDDRLSQTGRSVFCLDDPQSAVLQVAPADSIIWEKDGGVVASGTSVRYAVRASGEYRAVLYDRYCADPVRTRSVVMQVDTARPGIRYPDVRTPYLFPLDLQARPFGQQYAWSPITDLNAPFSARPYFKGLQSRQYTVAITTSTGCVTTDTQRVETYKKIEVYVPTVFSPNGDGLNDFLRPLLLGVSELRYFRVFDRWGKLLFETDQDRPGWDGKAGGKPLMPQTVVWMLEAVDIDGRVIRRNGTSSIL